jgi:hypothetical protein
MYFDLILIILFLGMIIGIVITIASLKLIPGLSHDDTKVLSS